MDNLVLKIDFFITSPYPRKHRLIVEDYVEKFLKENIDISQIKRQVTICITDDFMGAMKKYNIKKHISFDIAGFYERSFDKHYIMLKYSNFNPITFSSNQLEGYDKKEIDDALQELQHTIYHECQHMINNETIIPQLEAKPVEFMCISNSLCDEYIAFYQSNSKYHVMKVTDTLEKLYTYLKRPIKGSSLFVRDLCYFLIHIIANEQINENLNTFPSILMSIDEKYHEWLIALKGKLDNFIIVESAQTIVDLRNAIEESIDCYNRII